MGFRRLHFAADIKISSNYQSSELHLWQVLIHQVTSGHVQRAAGISEPPQVLKAALTLEHFSELELMDRTLGSILRLSKYEIIATT